MARGKLESLTKSDGWETHEYGMCMACRQAGSVDQEIVRLDKYCLMCAHNARSRVWFRVAADALAIVHYFYDAFGVSCRASVRGDK